MEDAEHYNGYYIGCTSDGEIARIKEYRVNGHKKLSRTYPDGGWFTHTVKSGDDTIAEVISIFNLSEVNFVPSSKEGGDFEVQIIKKLEKTSLERKRKN